MGVSLRIRVARSDDAAPIARVHVETWRDAYRGIVADTTLDNLSVEGRTSRWREILGAPPEVRSLNYVAEHEGSLVGFASGGPSRQQDLSYDAELYALYVRPGFQRQGVGQGLTRALVEDLRVQGFQSLVVGVFEANVSGRRFYETLGARAVGQTLADWDGAFYPEVFYGWPTLDGVATPAGDRRPRATP